MSQNEHTSKTSLFLGGSRSGKSVAAENLVLASEKAPVYLATAAAGDSEMAKRIDSHQKRRGPIWQTVEVALRLDDALKIIQADQIVMIDCLTLWLSNVMLAELALDVEIDLLLTAIKNCHGSVVCVSNELGMGLVPDTKLGRDFRDAQGLLNQQIAEISDLVVFVAAGLPLVLKGPNTGGAA